MPSSDWYHRKLARTSRTAMIVQVRLIAKSEPQSRESGVVVRPPAERPKVLALARGDRQVVDARDAPLHESRLIELPVLVAVGPEPVARVVVPFIRKAHGDAIPVAGPELLDEPVVELPGPLAHEELPDGLAAGEELGAVAPHAVGRVRERYALRVARVPGVLGHLHL